MRKIILSLITLCSMSLSGYITVTSPNGGETLYRGSSFKITWEDNISGDVRIDLYQNGSFLLPVVSLTPSDGSYTAEIPNELYGTNYKIRITSVLVPTTYDYSDGYFSVDIGRIDFITPAGSEEMPRGSLFEITWNSTGFQENLLITLNNSETTIDTIAVSTPNDGSFMWSVPVDIYGDNFTVKIASKLYPSIYDESLPFAIDHGYITLTSPTGGMVLEMLTDTLITWNDNIPEGVIIELRKAGVVKKTLSSASNGSMRWNFYDPDLTTGSDYSIRIRSEIFSTIYYQSSNFTIKGTPVAGGSLSGTWTEPNSPYILSDSVYVETTNTLTIEPGVKVNDIGIYGLNVNGRLNATGVPGNSVKFIDTTIDFHNSASADSSRIQYAEIETRSASTAFVKNYGDPIGARGYQCIQADDGGYVICGYNLDYSTYGDVYLLKTDSYGNELWSKTYGGTDYDKGYSISKTADGGYIIAGDSKSFSDYSDYDMYLIKTDSNGNELWSNNLSPAPHSNIDEWGNSVIQAADGGYVISGSYILKTDSNGEMIWYSGSESWYNSVIQTTDGCYTATGDAILEKINSDGIYLWSRDLGGDSGKSIIQTADGGYIICGEKGSSPVLIKTDSYGITIWKKTYKGFCANSVIQTEDGGYLMTGSTSSYLSDVFLLKTDSNGNELWYDTFGGTGIDICYSIAKTNDGSYVLAGETTSYGEADYNVYFIKVSGIESSCLKITEGTKLIVSNSIFRNANEFGIIIDNSSPVISNSLITGNRHGIKISGCSSQYIINNTIADNDSIGVFLDGNSDPRFVNNIIFGNGMHQVYLNDNLSDPAFYYNDIQDGIAGFGLNTGVIYNGSNSNNIDMNPLYVSGTYELQSISQCKDNGYPGLTGLTLGSLYIPQTDLTGNPRMSGSEIDIGAYEYYVPVITPDSPSNITTSIISGTLTIDWDDMPNANSYLIYSSNYPYGTFDYLATVSQSQWSISIGTDTKKFYNVVSSSESMKNIKPELKKKIIHKTSSNK